MAVVVVGRAAAIFNFSTTRTAQERFVGLAYKKSGWVFCCGVALNYVLSSSSSPLSQTYAVNAATSRTLLLSLPHLHSDFTVNILFTVFFFLLLCGLVYIFSHLLPALSTAKKRLS